MFNTKDEVIDLVTVMLSTAANSLTIEGLYAAVDAALAELKFTIPLSDTSKCYWLAERTRRHACYILYVASALKFKYKQVNLDQRFDHFERLIKQMDTAFQKALTDDLSTFINVSATQMFGTLHGAGFQYDFMGRDITYTDLTNYINSGV